MQNIWNFVLHNCILIFDAEHVYFQPQVTDFKNKEVTVYLNPKPSKKNENPKP